jgi:hypothetical protein
MRLHKTPLIAENKNRKRVRVYGFGPRQQVIIWDEVSDFPQLIEADADEWMMITEIGGS